MSSYYAPAYHPVERVIRKAFWIDDHFGPLEYGVQFDSGPVFRAEQCEIPMDKVFVETEK